MMSAKDLRLRAADARAMADTAPTPGMKDSHAADARAWENMALMAERHETDLASFRL